MDGQQHFGACAAIYNYDFEFFKKIKRGKEIVTVIFQLKTRSIEKIPAEIIKRVLDGGTRLMWPLGAPL